MRSPAAATTGGSTNTSATACVCGGRPDGGTLLHAVCANPLADERHLQVVLRSFGGDVRWLDDALRSPLQVLLTLRPTSVFVPLLERLEAEAAVAASRSSSANWRAALALLVARHKGLPRELGQRLTRQLRVAV